jgi:hypothetical protein
MTEKIKLGTATAAAVVAVGGTGLASTTPAVALGLLGSAAAGANLALALDDLATCLEQHGQPDMANILRQKAQAIRDELERLRQYAEQLGVSV